MSEARRIVRWFIPLAALAVIVAGLWPRPAEPSPEARVQALASSLKCPFCAGESIADATSQVARDLKVVIAEQVAEGRSDAEIRRFFVDRYGEQILLDPPARGWGLLVWATPVLVLAVGAAVIAGLRRRGQPVAVPEPMAVETAEAEARP